MDTATVLKVDDFRQRGNVEEFTHLQSPSEPEETRKRLRGKDPTERNKIENDK